MTVDLFTAIIVCAVLAWLWVQARRNALSRAERSARLLDGAWLRGDDTPHLLKARTWMGVRR